MLKIKCIVVEYEVRREVYNRCMWEYYVKIRVMLVLCCYVYKFEGF